MYIQRPQDRIFCIARLCIVYWPLDVFDLFNVESTPLINEIVSFNFTELIDTEGYYKDCVKLLIRSGLEIKQRDLANKISLESDIEKRKLLSKELSQIILKQNQLKKK